MSNCLPEENSFDSWLLKLEEYFDVNSGKIKIFHLNINSLFCKTHEVNRLLDKCFFRFYLYSRNQIRP
jgi:hypothetical protein